jgi:murein DD-endopeptidase MepM/ murein hydrolase activator NlpD
MTGMATLAGEKSVFLKNKGSREQMICGVGQVIGGFKIVSIQSDYTVFEGNGVHLWLALGPAEDEDRRGNMEDDDPEYAAGDPIEEATSPAKNSARGLKGKTTANAHGTAIDNRLQEALHRPSGGLLTINGKSAAAVVASASPAILAVAPHFILPIQGSVSSPFGYRKQPTGGARKYHKGIDIQAPMKSPVVASASGEVVEVSRSWAKGLNILIRHAGGYETAYFHLSSAAVKEGQKVSQGDLIAYEGVSGISTGPHLHFEIHRGEEPVDPALFVRELSQAGASQ